MSNIDKGLFVVNNLHSLNDVPKRAYCRIQMCSIYTNQIPGRNRLVSYKVAYWDDQPTTEEECAKFKTYYSPLVGNSIFLFNRNLSAVTEDDLIKECREHFLTVGLVNYKAKTLAESLATLNNLSQLPVFRKSEVTEYEVGVWNVIHIQRFMSENGLAPVEVSSTINYCGNLVDKDGQYVYTWRWQKSSSLSFNHIYKKYDGLIDAALNNFDNIEVLNKCVKMFATDLVVEEI